MDYNTLLDLVTELGYSLAMSGAETYRVEESVTRILNAYGISAEAFAIPNCLTVSLKTEGGKTISGIRRIGQHGNDLDHVEKLTNLSRKICAEHPDPAVAMEWLEQTKQSSIRFKFPVLLLGHFLGASGFCLFFGGSVTDCICAGICGLIICLSTYFMDKYNVNVFFKSSIVAFLMSFLAYVLNALWLPGSADSIIIGALMILVPGLLFTNAMRDIIYGDTNSGIHRIVQVLLCAVAIALGTGIAWNLSNSILTLPISTQSISHGWQIELLASLIGCIGFSVLFNIHGPGILLCAFGGVLTWGAYCLCAFLGGNIILSNFVAAVVAAAYSEIMARTRKYPAISYLVVSIFPLLPGAGIYYTTYHFVQGNMSQFTSVGSTTVATAGTLAVGILFVSTVVRLWNGIRVQKQSK